MRFGTDLYLVALQTAIGPMILISAVGLLLLSMTNRLGRTIDRARALAARAPDGSQHESEQLAVLWRRARTLRWSILLASASGLCGAMLVIFLFLSVWARRELAWLIGSLFVVAMGLLIASIVLFIDDVNRALEALKYEISKRKS